MKAITDLAEQVGRQKALNDIQRAVFSSTKSTFSRVDILNLVYEIEKKYSTKIEKDDTHKTSNSSNDLSKYSNEE